MSDRVLLLTPSRGLGGGIERYVETLEWAFAREGVDYARVDLSNPGAPAHRRMLADVVADLRASDKHTRMVVAHPRLLPVAVLAARKMNVDGISVLCYGCDVWTSPLRLRRQVEKALMRRANVRVVAISSFTAGALLGSSAATILPPGVTQEWFDTLVKASSLPKPARPHKRLVTVFRLADWRDKGLAQLLDAVAALGRADVELTVLGTGEASPGLLRLVDGYEQCVLRAGLADSELAYELAAADLLVLATRTRTGRYACGEGFGLVLLEAQLAGIPVVAPAYGGSHDAFVNQVTGVAPADESAEALAKVLAELLCDPSRLTQMGKRASEWARETFAPERYAGMAVARLM